MIKLSKTAHVRKLLTNEGFFGDVSYSGKFKHFIYKKSFFFTRGTSGIKISNKLADIFGTKIHILEAYDNWRVWPKDSNFVVKFNFDLD